MNPLLIGLLTLCASFSFADTFNHDLVHEKMDQAHTVVEVHIVKRETVPHPFHYAMVRAEAVIDRVIEVRHRDLHTLRSGDKIVIEALGGEIGGIGVAISGYPRPYLNQRYLAYLNHRSDGLYEITGFNHGLIPLDKTRDYSRNRTDGSDGQGSGPYLRWDPKNFPISYFIDADSFKNHVNFLPAIDAAFQSWKTPQDVKVDFLAVGCTQSSRVENDGINNVLFAKHGWKFDSSAIAINRSFYLASSDPRAGMILDSDIILNGQDHSFTTTDEAGAYDVQEILTHEVGHLLGLGHEIAPQNNSSAMYPFANTNETIKRTLSSNDLAGVKQIYPGVVQKTQGTFSFNSCNISTGNLGCASATAPARGTVNVTSLLVLFLMWLATLLFIPLYKTLFLKSRD